MQSDGQALHRVGRGDSAVVPVQRGQVGKETAELKPQRPNGRCVAPRGFRFVIALDMTTRARAETPLLFMSYNDRVSAVSTDQHPTLLFAYLLLPLRQGQSQSVNSVLAHTYCSARRKNHCASAAITRCIGQETRSTASASPRVGVRESSCFITLPDRHTRHARSACARVSDYNSSLLAGGRAGTSNDRPFQMETTP